MIRVDSNVPMPRSTRGAKAKYPFEGMTFGDSFAVDPDPLVDTRRNLQRLTMAAATWAKRRGLESHRYTARIVVEDGITKVRLWLTKKEPKK